ncbi:hypothetical protein [Bacillus sp. 1P06AnD]|uniref:hypothetical protein n=1 Tax=Bacillus sp. 1P06AnD TaxID=3132208 RepID=UPI0039A06151
MDDLTSQIMKGHYYIIQIEGDQFFKKFSNNLILEKCNGKTNACRFPLGQSALNHTMALLQQRGYTPIIVEEHEADDIGEFDGI